MHKLKYSIRWLRANLVIFIKKVVRKHPVKLVISVTFLMTATYFTLDRFAWGKQVLNLIITLLSAEITAYRLHDQGYPFWGIVCWFLIADAVSITIDVMLVNGLLKWRWSTIVINAIALSVKAFKNEIRKRFGTINGFQQISRISDHFNDLKKKPSKAGLATIYILGLLPRIPPLPGGVGIGVFILKYNKYGYLGWVVLIMGMLTRHSVVLGSIYGISSFF